MNSDSWIGKFYQFGEAVMFLLYVNFLWVLFTLLGLIFFGLGPSTVAMFTVFRKWVMGEHGLNTTKLFWQTYKKEFIRSNCITWIVGIIGLMLLTNLQYFSLENPTLNIFFKALFIFITFLYFIMLIYLYPLYVHYQNSFKMYFKNALLIAIYQPIRTIYVLAACFTLYYLWATFPIFIFLFGGSLTSMVVMYITYITFAKIEYKQSLLEKKQEKEAQQLNRKEWSYE
ncbi:YesL family protein [Gracilibacillus massiliensis]|uniref:YesL family protein n=1 Tax=Gracilibacillus massiliensis TaxID=1564956 RepID=UPI00071E3407|nr:YesL family protein [Gracilibacillus massiliensis]